MSITKTRSGNPAASGVELGADPADDAALLETAHAVQRRRRRQPDDARQLDVGAIGVVLQLDQQLDVDFVKCNRHATKLYCV